MNVEDQIDLYKYMRTIIIQKEQEVNLLINDINLLKQEIISNCSHINVSINYESDGHKSYMIRKCQLCHFDIL